jgi:hypothetical protein
LIFGDSLNESLIASPRFFMRRFIAASGMLTS